jgi:serine/threonine-protein kinase
MLVCPLCRVALDPTETTCPRDGREGEEQKFDSVDGELAERFTIVQPYARGATGTLYLADEKLTGRRGILKVLHNESGVSVTERQRLKRELVKQATLGDANMALPLVTGESDGRTWLFREWVEGVSLRVHLSRGGKLAPPEALAIAAQLASGLDELHRAGLLHRDLSPNHVILQPQPSGIPKVIVIDAGIAARVDTGAAFDIAGTPGYISPEQATGKLVSFRSDLYALGALLFEMLEGRPLFAADDDAALLAAHAEKELPTLPTNVPSGVQQLITQLLAKDPRERPFSAQQSKRVIEPFLPESKGHRDPTVSFSPQDTDAAVQPTGAAGSGTLRPPQKKMTIMGMPAAPGQPSKPPPPPPQQAARLSQPVASKPPPPPGANGKKRVSSVPPPPPGQAARKKGADSTEELDALDLEPIDAPVIAVAPDGSSDLDYDDLAETTAMDRQEANERLQAMPLAATDPAPAPEMAPTPVGQTAPGFPAPSASESAGFGSSPGVVVANAGPFDQASAVPPTAQMPMQPMAMQQPMIQPMQPTPVGMRPVQVPKKSKLPIILGVVVVGFCLVSSAVVGGGYWFLSKAQDDLVANLEGLDVPQGFDVEVGPGTAPTPTPAPVPTPEPAQIELQVDPSPTVEPEPQPEPEPAVVAQEEQTEREEREERTERTGTMERTASTMEREPTQPREPTMASGGNSLDALREQAREHWSAGNFQGAAQAYERAAALAPRDAGVYMGLGSARFRMRDYRGAVQAYQRAVEINPRNSGYMASLGRALLASGDSNGARQAYQRALALDPNNAAARQALEQMQ